MPQTVADPLCRPVTTCFPDLEPKNFNYLVLILSCLARALRQEKLRQTGAHGASGSSSTTKARAFAADLLRCSRVKYSIQLMIVANCKRGNVRLGHDIGAEQGVGRHLAQPELELALPVQLSAIISR
jgi:hypothetical protein